MLGEPSAVIGIGQAYCYRRVGIWVFHGVLSLGCVFTVGVEVMVRLSVMSNLWSVVGTGDARGPLAGGEVVLCGNECFARASGRVAAVGYRLR